jgi:hypothetical protein
MTLSLKGIVRGKTIELEHPPGLPEGQEVRVTVEPTPMANPSPGDGLRRAAGAWSDDPAGLDQYLEWNRQQRKKSRPPIDPRASSSTLTPARHI